LLSDLTEIRIDQPDRGEPQKQEEIKEEEARLR
jgi:hypothetical protein